MNVPNPFYAERFAGLPAPVAWPNSPPAKNQPALYVKLPQAPQNASPVPGLTSLYHRSDAGPYGNRSYPGNCSGYLIRDLLKYFGDRVRPTHRQRHLPRRLQGAGHLLLVQRFAQRFRCVRPLTFPGRLSVLLDPSALLETKIVHR
jgi:hypothetical protein